jgi:hypothetical protein
MHVATPLLVLIFLIAACTVASPPWPFADPDTPGYLQPPISKLAEGVLQHTDMAAISNEIQLFSIRP